MRESVDLTPMTGPHGLTEEASETIDRNSEVVDNFPASMQDSTALEPLQGEMIDNFHGNAVAKSPEGLTVREIMRRAGLTSETIWETVAARRKKSAGSRPAAFPLPLDQRDWGEVAESTGGRKRGFAAGDEANSRSSPSSVSSRSSDTRPSVSSRLLHTPVAHLDSYT